MSIAILLLITLSVCVEGQVWAVGQFVREAVTNAILSAVGRNLCPVFQRWWESGTYLVLGLLGFEACLLLLVAL